MTKFKYYHCTNLLCEVESCDSLIAFLRIWFDIWTKKSDSKCQTPEEVRHVCSNHYKFSALMSLRSRDNVQAKCTELVVIRALSDLLWPDPLPGTCQITCKGVVWDQTSIQLQHYNKTHPLFLHCNNYSLVPRLPPFSGGSLGTRLIISVHAPVIARN